VENKYGLMRELNLYEEMQGKNAKKDKELKEVNIIHPPTLASGGEKARNFLNPNIKKIKKFIHNCDFSRF
jgi:hypothetical protein